MNRNELSRRDFTRLSAAAFGGLVAGAAAGCSGRGGNEPAGQGASTPEEAPAAGAPAAETSAGSKEPSVAYLLDEPHVCRGLNTCANKGRSGENQCAGQGTCATVGIDHQCGQQNQCKGQGGCGGHYGQNACKGLGGCGVPLRHGWEEARAAFEKAMNDAGKEVGAAPAEG